MSGIIINKIKQDNNQHYYLVEPIRFKGTKFYILIDAEIKYLFYFIDNEFNNCIGRINFNESTNIPQMPWVDKGDALIAAAQAYKALQKK